MSNPFSTLGIPPAFDLNEADLHRRFIQLSSANHPDRFSDPDEQADAADASASINDAYRTLVNPESRANALLSLLGGAAKEKDTSLPKQFLIEVMEVREKLDEAIEADDKAALDELRAWANEQRVAHLAEVSRLFREAMTSADARQSALAQIRLELNVLRYFERMIEQMPSK